MDKIDVDAVRLRARVIATSSTLADSILRECVRAIDQLTAERDEARKERDKARAAVLDPIIASHAQIRETAQASDYISEPEADELAWTHGEYSALQAKLDAMQAAVVAVLGAKTNAETWEMFVRDELSALIPKPEPDPDLELARKFCAQARPDYATGFIGGDFDESSTEIRTALIAIRALKMRQRGYVVMKGEGDGGNR